MPPPRESRMLRACRESAALVAAEVAAMSASPARKGASASEAKAAALSSAPPFSIARSSHRLRVTPSEQLMAAGTTGRKYPAKAAAGPASTRGSPVAAPSAMMHTRAAEAAPSVRPHVYHHPMKTAQSTAAAGKTAMRFVGAHDHHEEARGYQCRAVWRAMPPAAPMAIAARTLAWMSSPRVVRIRAQQIAVPTPPITLVASARARGVRLPR